MTDKNDEEDEDASDYEREEVVVKKDSPLRVKESSLEMERMASFKSKSNVNDMQETLKLIQQVASSILVKQDMPYKAKVKAHVTRIPTKPVIIS